MYLGKRVGRLASTGCPRFVHDSDRRWGLGGPEEARRFRCWRADTGGRVRYVFARSADEAAAHYAAVMAPAGEVVPAEAVGVTELAD